jgi:cupin fold WbuC family metalloprotein
MIEPRSIQVIDQRQIEELAMQAIAVRRRRAHLLLHDGPADPVQRLVIVLQPNSYVRPHRHSRQWEMLVLQQGRGALLIFDGKARLVDRIQLSPIASVVQIPIGMWHGFVVLERNTTVLEIKPGPYVPNEFADWAPKEEAVNAGRFVKWATSAAVGANWTR